MKDTLLDDLRAACFDTETGLPLPDSHLPECCVDSVRRAADEIERLRAELAALKAPADAQADADEAGAVAYYVANPSAAPVVEPKPVATVTPPSSVAVTDDGSVLLLDGDRIAARLTAQQAANVAALVQRYSGAA